MNTVEAIALLSSSSDDFASIMTGGGGAASSSSAAADDNNNSAGEVDESLPRRFTDHTYHDFSNYIKEGGELKKHKKSESNFPARLHAMLSDEQYSHIITWMPHGRAWKILDRKRLETIVIPKYFGKTKYSSFVRQLSGWGFKRLHRSGPDYGSYYHECFLRGHPRLTILMRRIPLGQGKASPNTHEEPDFYEYEKDYPLCDTNEKPIYSPEEIYSPDEIQEVKKEEEEKSMEGEKVGVAVATTTSQQEVMNLDPLPAVFSGSSHNLDSLDMAWTRAAPICNENGLCEHDHQFPSQDEFAGYPPPYLQSLLHDLLVSNPNSTGDGENIETIPEDDFDFGKSLSPPGEDEEVCTFSPFGDAKLKEE